MRQQLEETVAPVATVRVVRDTKTLQSEQHGYVNFYTFQDAEKVLKTLDGSVLYRQRCLLSWSTRAKQPPEPLLSAPPPAPAPTAVRVITSCKPVSSMKEHVAPAEQLVGSLEPEELRFAPTPCRRARAEDFHSPSDPFEPKWTIPRTPVRSPGQSRSPPVPPIQRASAEVATQTDPTEESSKPQLRSMRRSRGTSLLLQLIFLIPGLCLAWRETTASYVDEAAICPMCDNSSSVELLKIQAELERCHQEGCGPTWTSWLHL
eukprot:g14978.t1